MSEDDILTALQALEDMAPKERSDGGRNDISDLSFRPGDGGLRHDASIRAC